MCRLIFILSCALLINSAWARNFRVAQLPNGTRYQCMNCHLNPVGGAVNIFGLDIMRTLNGDQANWQAVCALDSDADGYSNGQELGDPNCTWMIGQPSPNVAILSNPADRFSTPVIREDMAIPMDMAVRDMMIVDAQIPLDQSIDVIDLFLVDGFVGDAFYSSGGRYEEDLAIQSVDMQMSGQVDQSVGMVDLGQMDSGIGIGRDGGRMDLGQLIDQGERLDAALSDLGQGRLDMNGQGDLGPQHDLMLADQHMDINDMKIERPKQTQNGCHGVKSYDLEWGGIWGLSLFLSMLLRRWRFLKSP